jgi:hypothetical protein
MANEQFYKKNQPDTYDFLRPNGFVFVMKDLPNIKYTVQSVSLPGVSLPFAEQPTPFVNIPYAGDKMNFDELTLRFIVSENLENYLEIYNWLVGLAFPDNHEQYVNYINSRENELTTARYLKETRDASLIILNSSNNAKLNIQFKDAFPISLSGVEFDLSTTTVDYLQAMVTFKYQSFKIQKI